MQPRFAVNAVIAGFFAIAFSSNVQAADPRVRAGASNAPFLTGITDAASLERSVNARLAEAQKHLDRLLAVKGPRTIENTLVPYDDISLALEGGGVGVLSQVHPDAALRSSADALIQKLQAFSSELTMNRQLYEALASLDLSGADAETKYYVQHDLTRFKLNGVDKDEATRTRINQLRTQLTGITQEFNKNAREGTRTIAVKSVAELDGLPADFIARHKPDANGVITLNTEAPDSEPVMLYAKSEDLRRRMSMESGNVGYPANIEVLKQMLATRGAMAKLLGFNSWAEYDAASRMSETAKNASDFIDHIVTASGPKANKEYAQLLKRKQQDVPGATVVNGWEQSYYSELVRKSSYDFDSQSIRPYFAYDRVRQGVFDVTGKLFGLTYQPAKNAPVWDPSVEAFEALEKGKVVSRFYLDMHPRPSKGGSGATTYGVRTGLAGNQIPEGVLVCRFPGGQAGDPGLMTQADVRTFFHEFGHLIHGIVAGRHEWIGVGGIRTERDFVEAPSQMLEEWMRDPGTLATFAKHYQTNEPVPAALVKKMSRADEFGQGLGVRRQMVLAKLALSMHDRDPQSVDTTAMLKDFANKYLPFPFMEGRHDEASFPHLANPGYASAYYTYMWSLVIAKDLFSKFDNGDLLSPGVARRYRDTVLAPGGSKPAAQLIQDFLGRPFNFAAWEKWLNLETP